MRISHASQKPRKNLLALAGTCLLFSSITEAQVVSSGSAEESATAADAASASSEASDDSMTVIEVMGKGSARTKAAVSSNYIEVQAPGVTPQTLLADLPGVNVQTSDPYGMYELNDRLIIRGFSATQLGMTIDGVPFVDSLSEGGTIAHYLLTEDLAGAEVSPGAGDVTQPAVSALGGAIRYISKNPTDDMGGQLSATAGRFGFSRLFGKLDTGSLWQGGPSAYVAAQRNHSYQWEHYGEIEGMGGLEADHAETKIVQKWGRNSVALKASWDKRSNWDTENVDLKTMEATTDGTLYYNLVDDPTLWAGYWRNGTEDTLVSLRGVFSPTDNVNVAVTPYYNDHKYWLWYGISADAAEEAYEDAIEGTPGRTDIVEPNGEVAQRIAWATGNRAGVTSSLTWNIGPHTVESGIWYENNNYSYYKPIQNTDPDTGKILVNEVTSVSADYDIDSKIFQPFLKDTAVFFDDRLTIQAGAKALQVKRSMVGYRNADDFNSSSKADISSTYSDWFQPQAGLTYTFNDLMEGFVNYAENFSAVTISALTSAIYNANIKPESTKNVDFGVRFKGSNWSGYLSGYSVKYKDRIIGLSSGNRLSAVTGTTYLNVSGSSTRGVELSGDWSPLQSLKLSTSWSFSKSIYDANYYSFEEDDDGDWVQDVLVAVKGNYVPDQPLVQGNLNAYYTLKHFGANLGMQYMGKRYADSMNDLTARDYLIWNGGISWSGLPGEKLHGLTFRVTAYNLLDKAYISSLNTNVSSATGKRGYPRATYGSIEYSF
ncbi:MAG: TonB-dependent receptor [Solimonas sp.]